jgi:4-hydroxythreonine-4-phosphate dehydrogenase
MPQPRLAITQGDPAGVGPELALRTLQHPDVLDICVPIVFGDLSVLQRVAERLKLEITADRFTLNDENWKRGECPAIVDFGHESLGGIEPGHVDARTGAASYAYVKRAIEAAMDAVVDGIVTGPIHKEAFHAAGVPYPGHTEMLADLTRCGRYCMTLTSDELTCSLVTAHVGLRDVPGLLTTARILEVIELTAEAMERLHARAPRLTVCGLNPHAGEHGLFGGGEEERIIVPAIHQARLAGWDVVGPLPPDTAFVAARRRQTDAYVCMYHDQGLIPLKALAFETGINVTLGLPIVRTSVDHGTALDIAWQGKADFSSMRSAVRWAARFCRKRSE